jgi:hypothetical protein
VPTSEDACLGALLGLLKCDSATLRSTQWIINAAYNIDAHYNQRLFTLLELTAKKEANTCVALPKLLSALGARTFPTIIRTSVVQDLNEKIASFDCRMR